MKVDRQKIIRLRKMGVTYDAIAERLGCSHATINLAMKGRGLTRSEANMERAIEKAEHDRECREDR